MSDSNGIPQVVFAGLEWTSYVTGDVLGTAKRRERETRILDVERGRPAARSRG